MNIVAIYYTVKQPLYNFSSLIKAFWDHLYQEHNQRREILVRTWIKSSIIHCTIKEGNFGSNEKNLNISQIIGY